MAIERVCEWPKPRSRCTCAPRGLRARIERSCVLHEITGTKAALMQAVVAIGLDQPLEHPDLAADLVAALGVGHLPRAVPGADDRDLGDDVDAVANCSLDRLE